MTTPQSEAISHTVLYIIISNMPPSGGAVYLTGYGNGLTLEAGSVCTKMAHDKKGHLSTVCYQFQTLTKISLAPAAPTRSRAPRLR